MSNSWQSSFAPKFALCSAGVPVSAACKLLGSLPSVAGLTGKAAGPWVCHNLWGLEQLALCMGQQLKQATPQDLAAAITGFAQLR